MKRTVCGILSLSILLLGCSAAAAEGAGARILYQGHGSLRIVTEEGKVIYIDPYAGEGYDLPADLYRPEEMKEQLLRLWKEAKGC